MRCVLLVCLCMRKKRESHCSTGQSVARNRTSQWNNIHNIHQISIYYLTESLSVLQMHVCACVLGPACMASMPSLADACIFFSLFSLLLHLHDGNFKWCRLVAHMHWLMFASSLNRAKQTHSVNAVLLTSERFNWVLWLLKFGPPQWYRLSWGWGILGAEDVQESLKALAWTVTVSFCFFIIKCLGRKRSSGCVCCSQVKAQYKNIWEFATCAALYTTSSQCWNVFLQTDSMKAKQNRAYLILLPDLVRVWSAWTRPGSEAVSSVSSEPLTWSMHHSAPIRLDWPHWTQTWLK